MSIRFLLIVSYLCVHAVCLFAIEGKAKRAFQEKRYADTVSLLSLPDAKGAQNSLSYEYASSLSHLGFSILANQAFSSNSKPTSKREKNILYRYVKFVKK